MSYPLNIQDKLKAAKAIDTGYFLTAREVEALLYDLATLREANTDYASEYDALNERVSAALWQSQTAQDRAHEFEAALKFANETNEELLRQIANLEQRLEGRAPHDRARKPHHVVELLVTPDQQHVDRCSGFGDCDCPDCFPVVPDTPLADHGTIIRNGKATVFMPRWFYCFALAGMLGLGIGIGHLL